MARGNRLRVRGRKEERGRDSSKSRALLVFSVQSLCSKERAVLPLRKIKFLPL